MASTSDKARGVSSTRLACKLFSTVPGGGGARGPGPPLQCLLPGIASPSPLHKSWRTTGPTLLNPCFPAEPGPTLLGTGGSASPPGTQGCPFCKENAHMSPPSWEERPQAESWEPTLHSRLHLSAAGGGRKVGTRLQLHLMALSSVRTTFIIRFF